MSLTFTKLFSSITESTIWLEPAPTRLVWITMLAMSNRNGLVFGSVPGLAHRARVSVEECRAALDTFLAPDIDSRTKDNEGRRLAVVDGGWELLNYAKYRAIQDAESIKESKRNYMRRTRSGALEKWNDDSTVDNLPLPLDLPSEEKEKRPRRRCRIPDDFQPNAKHAAEAAKLKLNLADEFEAFKLYWIGEGRVKANWDATLLSWLRKAPTLKRGGKPAPKSDEPIRYVR